MMKTREKMLRLSGTNDDTPLADLAVAINQAHKDVEVHFGTACARAIDAGRLLLAAKEKVPHGEWKAWLDKNCAFSERTAQLYMQSARYLNIMPDLQQQLSTESLRGAAELLKKEYDKRFHSRQVQVVHLEEEYIEAVSICGHLQARLREMVGAEEWNKLLYRHDLTDVAAALESAMPLLERPIPLKKRYHFRTLPPPVELSDAQPEDKKPPIDIRNAVRERLAALKPTQPLAGKKLSPAQERLATLGAERLPKPPSDAPTVPTPTSELTEKGGITVPTAPTTTTADGGSSTATDTVEK
jgi:hypothetical protein